MNRFILHAGFANNHGIRAFITALILICSGAGSLNAQILADSSLKQVKQKNQVIKIRKSDSLRLELHQRHFDASREFYSKIRSGTRKSFLSRQLYPLLFRNPVNPGQIDPGFTTDTIPFRNLEGRVIRKISIHKAGVFGTTVFDTAIQPQFRIDRIMNSLHFNTHDAIIKSYLQFHEGELLSPITLADNERILRQTAIFEDARILVNAIPGSDSVDVWVITRDVFPLGFDLKIRNARSSAFRLYNRNILGLGQQIEQSFDINLDRKPVIYFNKGGCMFRNIGQSLTNAGVVWQTSPDNRMVGFQLSKPYLSPETKLIGGVHLSTSKLMMVPGSQAEATTLEYSVYDLWGGYSFDIRQSGPETTERSVLAIAGRYYKLDSKGSPSLVLQPLYAFFPAERVLVSASLMRSGYRRTNMMYGFGRTEDIPSGHLFRLTLGYEPHGGQKKFYSAVSMVKGLFLQQNGFLYTWVEGGGYLSGRGMNDAVAGLGLDYISHLYRFGGFRMRNFLSLSYISLINRQSENPLELKNSDYMNVFRHYNLSGDQRLSARIEAVLFSPYFLLGFRFAPYAFLEAGVIAAQSQFISEGSMVPAFGAGIRIKNENLAFSTFQIGLTIYGKNDASGNRLMFGFSDVPQVSLERLGVGAPELIRYR